MKKLTPKQQAFIDEYLISLNASESARKAGYSVKTANRIATENLSKPVIQEAIQKRLQEKQSERIARQDEILEHLTGVMRGNIEPDTVRVKAAELLGKRYALFTEKIEHIGDIKIKVTLTDD